MRPGRWLDTISPAAAVVVSIIVRTSSGAAVSLRMKAQTAHFKENRRHEDFFKAEIRQAQLKFTELQWKLQDEMEKMVSLVKQPRVDEQQALAQLDKVLAAEREVKKEQITLLVRIKNKLMPEQQAKLAELRNKPTSK